MPILTRRQFLRSAGAAIAGAGAYRLVHPASVWAKKKENAIQHVIVVMMENRSFDHVLGWLPGADGRQAGLAFPDRNGVLVPTFNLAPDFQGCGHPDPDHSFQGGRVEYNSGACDGWLRAGANDEYSIGYYTAADLPFLGQAAPAWTVCDRYFAAIMAETFPNRLYMHSAVTDRIDGSLAPTTLPTIWDRLAARGLDGRYYFSDSPFLGLWGDKYLPIMRPYEQFLADCASGDLPHVAYVDPRFLGEEEGISGDDHPHSDIRTGEWFLSETYRAVISSPAWRHTVLFINFDEWGGFFEHVPPSTAPDVSPDLQLRGFRVPCLIVSPYARRGAVTSRVYDHTSILKMIENRFGLPPLSVRDANANDIGDELDFSAGTLATPDFDVPFMPLSPPCALG